MSFINELTFCVIKLLMIDPVPVLVRVFHLLVSQTRSPPPIAINTEVASAPLQHASFPQRVSQSIPPD